MHDKVYKKGGAAYRISPLFAKKEKVVKIPPPPRAKVNVSHFQHFPNSSTTSSAYPRRLVRYLGTYDWDESSQLRTLTSSVDKPSAKRNLS